MKLPMMIVGMACVLPTYSATLAKYADGSGSGNAWEAPNLSPQVEGATVSNLKAGNASNYGGLRTSVNNVAFNQVPGSSGNRWYSLFGGNCANSMDAVPGLSGDARNNNMSFSITADEGQVLNLQTFSFNAAFTCGTSPATAGTFWGYGLYYRTSSDGEWLSAVTGTNEAANHRVDGGMAVGAMSAAETATYDLTGLADLQNAKYVEFAILGIMSDKNSNKNVAFSNITLDGAVTKPVPEPGSSMLGLAGLAMLALRRRK